MPGERVPDPVPCHAVHAVALVELCREQPHPVLDAPFLEIVGDHRGRGPLEHAEASLERFEDDLLHPLGRHVVGRHHEQAPPRPGLGLGEVADRGLGQLSVGNDHVSLVERNHLRGPPVDLDHLADVGLVLVVLDPVTHLERPLGVDREAREHVAQRVSEGEAERRRHQGRSREQVAGVDARLVEHRHERGGEQHPAKHVEEDPRPRAGKPFPERHGEDHQGRLQERGEQEEVAAVAGQCRSLGRLRKQQGDQVGHRRQHEQQERPDRHPSASPGHRRQGNRPDDRGTEHLPLKVGIQRPGGAHRDEHGHDRGQRHERGSEGVQNADGSGRDCAGRRPHRQTPPPATGPQGAAMD